MPNTTLADFGLLRVLAGMTTLALAGAGCGGAEVKVAFDHHADSSSGQALTVADGNTPSVFGMKLVTIYLVEDRSADMNNVGNVGRIWLNPACDPDGYKCSIAPTAGAHQIQDYFDLALPTSEVNARLNSQGSEIKPGTYRYLHMDLAGPIASDEHTAPNLQFGTGAGTSQVRLMNNGYLVRLDPPMVIADGDTVTVTLGYDVRGSYFTGADLDAFHPPAGTTLDQWYCGDQSRTPARGPCLRFSGFTPAVSRETK
jgi:hypothetical protein